MLDFLSESAQTPIHSINDTSFFFFATKIPHFFFLQPKYDVLPQKNDITSCI